MILDKNKLQEITGYLHAKGLIKGDEPVLSADKPGEGNMNYTLRIKTARRSLIIKQARPYVEKYPQIPAPVERILAEGTFYLRTADSQAIQSRMPEVLMLDKDNHILVMQDMGISSDFSSIYKKGNDLSGQDVKDLAAYLDALHTNFRKDDPDELLANRTLRKLNHEHIFVYPLMENNGLDLNTVQPGLEKLAKKFKKNIPLKNKSEELGMIYLGDGDTLLHGDFYPGSWLETSDGIKVIDPEFCFYGKAEFDISVLMAHFYMALQPEEYFSLFYKNYNAVVLDTELVKALTGMEIIRRIIGLAQLPLDLSLEEKDKLLTKALDFMNIN